LAAIVLLFDVGLETNIGLLMRYSLAGVVVGLGGAIVSFVVGAGAVVLFSETLFGQSLSFFDGPCLMLGTVTTATSVGITARILSQKRKMDSPEGVTILSAAVIDDVIGIILLAVVMGVMAARRPGASGIDWGHVAMIAVKAVGVWLVATALGLLASRRISLLLKWFGQKTSIAVMALGLALVLAGLFEEAGLAMIIGAYVMGLSLSRADISQVVRERLHPVRELLIPVFFCVMGMRINLQALGSPGILTFGVAYAVAALGAKAIGAGMPAMLANFNLRGALRVGFGMAPRCEVALIVAAIGLSAGLLNAELFTAVIIMVLINTIVAPPALVALFASDAPGTRTPVSLAQRSRTSVPFEFPTPEMAEFLLRELLVVFENEGFFVHTLDRGRGHYQLRKDTTIVDVVGEGANLTFHCPRQDVPLVSTAMVEAVAALEQAIRGLQMPLDAQPIGSRIQAEAPAGKRGMSLRDYITVDLIDNDLQGSSKEEVIDELLDRLDQAGLLRDRPAARQAVLTRESNMSTGLAHGVAIPHGRTDTVDHLICSMGVHRRGVDFGALDDQPSHIFFLTLSPTNKPAPHVQFMSTVSQVLNASGRERILACHTKQEIYEVLITPPSPGRPAPAPPSRSA
jgi:Kef-type K+ transport system membrane component KefB/mannitol/fructose-specific phosphotransferase system IIA component (Ntr-type)